MNYRIGFGYDVHALQKGRQLVLGGVKIPYPLGLAGHSDADVLLHAVMDAILGAASLGDIGGHFPPGDPGYKDISSIILLNKVNQLLQEAGFKVVNVDSTLVAENPRLSPYVEDMCLVIARALDLEKNAVSVKATTTESLGFAGRGEGIAAYAVVLIEKGPRERC